MYFTLENHSLPSLISTFQIRDWLTLEEEMLRQQAVIVGDVDDILQVLDKQKVRYSSDLSHYVCDGAPAKNRGMHSETIFHSLGRSHADGRVDCAIADGCSLSPHTTWVAGFIA